MRRTLPQTTVVDKNPDLVVSEGGRRSREASVSVKPFFHTLLSSTFILTGICLCVLDMTLNSSKPLKYVQIGSRILQDGNPVRTKLERLNQPWYNPDVLMIGSSLSREAFALTDAYVQHKRAPEIGYELNSYGKSVYLEEQLQKLTGKKHTTLDLSVGGCMASDAYFLLNKAVEERPQIRLLILPVAPRDFVDNFSEKDPEMSAVGMLLKKKSLATIVSQKSTEKERFESALSSFWYLFDTRADYQAILEKLGCQFFNRAPNIYEAKKSFDPFGVDNLVIFNPPHNRADQVLPQAIKEEDARKNSIQYNPYNPERLKVQFQYFEKSLKFCRDKGITVVVVDMPLPEINRREMSVQLSSDYESNLLALCSKYSTRLLRLQKDPDFLDCDFRDSCHVVGSGGKKVIDRLIDFLASDPSFGKSIGK